MREEGGFTYPPSLLPAPINFVPHSTIPNFNFFLQFKPHFPTLVSCLSNYTYLDRTGYFTVLYMTRAGPIIRLFSLYEMCVWASSLEMGGFVVYVRGERGGVLPIRRNGFGDYVDSDRVSHWSLSIISPHFFTPTNPSFRSFYLSSQAWVKCKYAYDASWYTR